MKWEYRVVEAENHTILCAFANVLGAEGWEMIHAHETAGFAIGFFKRPVADVG